MPHANPGEYLLGVNQEELERLRFQHGVWKPTTDAFFDRLGVSGGWRCLDVGAGPGFVTIDLRERVGSDGEVVALEPSDFYHSWLRAEAARRTWTNVVALQGFAEHADLPAEKFDLIYLRWVLSFVQDPEPIVRRLTGYLKSGGVIAVQDYYYEGLSLFPRGGAFDDIADVVREHYVSGGGDPYVTGKLPAIFGKLGLTLEEFTPTCLAGGPQSGVMEWAHRFFTVHMKPMVEKGLLSEAEGKAILDDWKLHRDNPDTLFFSPIVVSVAGKLGTSRSSG
jgi:SAM-dependent methyltransferase